MKTLIIVDTQYDFMPGGALEVPQGDAIVPVINKVQPAFDLVIATQDWHPPHHTSFASNHEGKNVFDEITLHGTKQVLWPEHCIQGSKGAAFHKDLEMNAVETIFRKGMDPEIDSYSGFYDNGHLKSTGLKGYLQEKGVKDVYFCGLAADICVYYTLLDALKEGFHVHLLTDATKALDDDAFAKQLEQLEKDGVHIMKSSEIT